MFTETHLASEDLGLNLAVGPPNGPPLLLLHGVGRCWQDYVSLAATLATRWQLLALDFRGHGSSQRAASYRVTDYVRDAAAVLSAYPDEPVAILGHSLGAMVAAAIAAEFPARVRAVVLEDPPFGTLGSNIRQTAYHGMFTAFRQLAAANLDVDALVEMLSSVTMATPGKPQRLRLGELRDAASLRFMAKCLSRLDPQTMTPLVEGHWLTGYDQEALLRRIACPVLFLQGDYALGGMLNDEEAARVAALLSRGIHVKVAGAGHLIHSLQTETTLRLITTFLESL